MCRRVTDKLKSQVTFRSPRFTSARALLPACFLHMFIRKKSAPRDRLGYLIKTSLNVQIAASNFHYSYESTTAGSNESPSRQITNPITYIFTRIFFFAKASLFAGCAAKSSARTAQATNGPFPSWYIACTEYSLLAAHLRAQEYIKPVRVCIKCKKLCWKAEAIVAAINANDVAAMQVTCLRLGTRCNSLSLSLYRHLILARASFNAFCF
jgi:hypothetical protein